MVASELKPKRGNHPDVSAGRRCRSLHEQRSRGRSDSDCFGIETRGFPKHSIRRERENEVVENPVGCDY